MFIFTKKINKDFVSLFPDKDVDKVDKSVEKCFLGKNRRMKMWKKNLLYTSVILRIFVNPKNDLYIFYKIVYFIDSKDSSYSYYRSIFCTLSDDPLRRCGSMHYLVISHIDCHMSRIAKYISGLSFFIRNTVTGFNLTGSGEFNTKVCVYTHYKSRTVAAVRKARTAVYVRIAHKLAGIFHNLLSESI